MIHRMIPFRFSVRIFACLLVLLVILMGIVDIFVRSFSTDHSRLLPWRSASHTLNSDTAQLPNLHSAELSTASSLLRYVEQQRTTDWPVHPDVHINEQDKSVRPAASGEEKSEGQSSAETDKSMDTLTSLQEKPLLSEPRAEESGAEAVRKESRVEPISWRGLPNGSEGIANTSRAVCVGRDASLGEVEDLLCLPKPHYDQRMKNPCWWSDLPPGPLPQNNQIASSLMANLETAKTKPSTNASAGHLSCLPYFHILCCSKSGTTDLYKRIKLHPDLVPNNGIYGKERLWWSWAKYDLTVFHKGPNPKPFSMYVHGFRNIATVLQQAATNNTDDLARLVTLDGSPPDLWDLRGWRRLPQNRHLRTPAVMTPHLMKHLYRDPKFIVLVREPVERLYTSFLFHRMGKTAESFHQAAEKALSLLEHCLHTAPNRIECFVNESFSDKMPVLLHYSCYSVYFRLWLEIFPREAFLFLRTEDYARDVRGTLLKVFSFLGMARPSEEVLRTMVAQPNTYHTRSKDQSGPMLDATRQLLRKWVQPWNRDLAELLQDNRYLWEDV